MTRRFITLAAAALVALAGLTAPPAAVLAAGAAPIAVKSIPVHAAPGAKTVPHSRVWTSAKSARSALAGGRYHYAGGYQFLGDGTAGTGATQVAALVSQHRPFVCVSAAPMSCSPSQGAQHSNWELAAQSYDQQQIVEVMWTVDYAVCGQVNFPCLAVFSWVNGVGQGYNGSNPGWADNPTESVGAGTALAYTATGSVPTAIYQYRIERQASAPSWCTTCGTGWRLIQKNQGATDRVIGMFKDSLWTSQGASFTEAGLVQSFGEMVSAVVDDPCMGGGSGVFGTSTDPSAAAVHAAYSTNAPGEVNTPDSVAVWSDPAGSPAASPTAYRVYQVPGQPWRWKWGGPGWNASGTGTGSVNAC